MVVVDVPVLVHTADDGMEVRYAVLGFLVQPYGGLAARYVGAWGNDIAVLVTYLLAVESRRKVIPQSIAGLISMRMTLFLMFAWFMVANFISVHIPVASMPCGMKLSQMRVIFSGCFLFFDSPDT